MRAHVRQREPFRWEGIPVRPYKEEGAHFRGITRQVLVDDPEGLGAQLRYFEIEPGGYSSLERHEHPHSVVVVRGRGRCLVGPDVYELAANDLVFVPPHAWHQFRAADDEPLGFLCLVPCERDAPVRPDAEELRAMCADPEVGAFIRT